MSAPGLGVRQGWVHMGCGVMRLRVGSLGFDPVDFPKGHFTNHMGPSSQRTPVARELAWAVSTPRAEPRRWAGAGGHLSGPSRQGYALFDCLSFLTPRHTPATVRDTI